MKAAREIDLRRITYAVFQNTKGGNSRQGTIVAITSPLQGEGVTHVSRLLCRELATDQLGRTLYCTVDALAHSPLELELESFYILTDGHLWTLAGSDVAAKSAWEFKPTIRQARMEALRRRFDYVILDCPAVAESSDVVSVAPLVDAVLLVVGAGRSTKRQIDYAQHVIAQCGGQLRGCVLNRRTYPVPSVIFNFLQGHSR